MIVRFVEAHTRRPMGMAFYLCQRHYNEHKVPEQRILEVVGDQGDECDECRKQKFWSPFDRETYARR